MLITSVLLLFPPSHGGAMEQEVAGCLVNIERMASGESSVVGGDGLIAGLFRAFMPSARKKRLEALEEIKEIATLLNQIPKRKGILAPRSKVHYRVILDIANRLLDLGEKLGDPEKIRLASALFDRYGAHKTVKDSLEAKQFEERLKSLNVRKPKLGAIGIFARTAEKVEKEKERERQHLVEVRNKRNEDRDEARVGLLKWMFPSRMELDEEPVETIVSESHRLVSGLVRASGFDFERTPVPPTMPFNTVELFRAGQILEKLSQHGARLLPNERNLLDAFRKKRDALETRVFKVDKNSELGKLVSMLHLPDSAVKLNFDPKTGKETLIVGTSRLKGEDKFILERLMFVLSKRATIDQYIAMLGDVISRRATPTDLFGAPFLRERWEKNTVNGRDLRVDPYGRLFYDESRHEVIVVVDGKMQFAQGIEDVYSKKVKLELDESRMTLNCRTCHRVSKGVLFSSDKNGEGSWMSLRSPH